MTNAPAITEDFARMHGGRVLVVEDERAIGSLFNRVLDELGYSVEVLDDGTAAMRRLGEASYDLLVLDLHLPGASGWEILRRRQELARPPLTIVTSGVIDPAVAERARRSGAHEFLPKPFTLEELHRCLESLPRTEAAAAPATQPPRTTRPRRHPRSALRAVLEVAAHNPAATAVTNAEGRIAGWNPAAVELFGWSEQEAAGRTLEDLVGLVGASLHGDHPLRDRDGRPLYLEASPVAVPGGTCWFFRHSQGVDDRVTLAAFVAGLAHEVRNPLFSISATVDAFEAQFGARDDELEFIEHLRVSVRRLASLTSDLIEFGRPIDLDLLPRPVEPIVTQSVAACTPLAQEVGVSLVTQAGPLALVRTSGSSLHQVLVHLLQNAVQHSTTGGEVELVAAMAEDWVEIVIQDRGPGIDPAVLPRLFQPFVSRRRGGTGLGLAIARRIVEAHGGTIAAHNRPGGGARFRLCVPAVRPA